MKRKSEPQMDTGKRPKGDSDKHGLALVPKLRFPEFRDAGAWEEKKLDELSSSVNNRTSLAELTLDDYVSTENILPDFSGVKLAAKLPPSGSAVSFKKHDILVANIRPYLKKIWFSDRSGGASNDVIVIRPTNGIINKYLSFLLMTDRFIAYVMKGAKGVKMPRGDISLIKKYSITLPPEREEQQKIADCLSSLDELITAQTQKIDTLKAHKKGLMQQLFPARGETVPKLRFPEFRDAGAWKEKKLDELSSFVNNRTSLAELTLDDYVSTENILPDFSGVKLAAKLPPSGSAVSFKKHDILVANIRPYLKKIWFSDRSGGASNDVIVIRPTNGIINKYLSFLLMTDRFIAYVMKGAKGVKMPRGDISLIKKYSITLPPEREEQQKIAACLSSLDELITAQTQKIATLKAHKKGLMQQLFPSVDEVEG